MSEPHSTDEALRPLDDEAVRILVENHRNFRSFLAKRVGSEALAEDLLQQSLKKALESPVSSGEETTVLAWFYRVLRNTLIDHYRSQASREKRDEELLKELVARGEHRTAAPDEVEAAVCRCMADLLPRLKPAYAELIRRIDLQEEEASRVARDLGITPGNLNVRLHRARHALKASLVEACGTCTEHGCLDCTCA